MVTFVFIVCRLQLKSLTALAVRMSIPPPKSSRLGDYLFDSSVGKRLAPNGQKDIHCAKFVLTQKTLLVHGEQDNPCAIMNSSPRLRKVRRNLTALFVLAFLLTVLASALGACILVIGESHPAATLTMPAWEYGQGLMLFGLINVFVYGCIFFQVRMLIRGFTNENAV
jgi:hypothetical protein